MNQVIDKDADLVAEESVTARLIAAFTCQAIHFTSQA